MHTGSNSIKKASVHLLHHLEWGAPAMLSGCWIPCLLRKRWDMELAELRRTRLHFAALNDFSLSFAPIAHCFSLTWSWYFGLLNALDGTWWMPVLLISVWWAERKIQLLEGLHLMKFIGDVMYLSLFSVFCWRNLPQGPYKVGSVYYFSLYKVQYPREGAE